MVPELEYETVALEIVTYGPQLSDPVIAFYLVEDTQRTWGGSECRYRILCGPDFKFWQEYSI